MPKRTIAFLALAFALAGAGSAGATTPPTTRSPLALRTVRFIINNHTGGTLHLKAQTTFADDTWRETPGDIADGEVGDYTVTAVNQDVGGDLHYSLPEGGYVLHVQGDNPRALPNDYKCEVQAPGTSQAEPPFECTIVQDQKGYNDTNFHVDVNRIGSLAAGRASR